MQYSQLQAGQTGRQKECTESGKRAKEQTMKLDDISVKLTADTEQFAEDMNVATDAVDMYADAVNRVVPNITLRGCTNIYMTINNFNETEKEWSEVADDE